MHAPRRLLFQPEIKKIQLSVWRVRNHYYDQKKKVLVVCLAGARSLLRPEKKVVVVCLAGARSKNNDPCQDMKPGPPGKLIYYYFYHGSNLREIIQFYAKLNVSNLDVMIFVLVLVQIDLIHFEHSICISSLELKLIQIR
jgi:hypothetical protein